MKSLFLFSVLALSSFAVDAQYYNGSTTRYPVYETVYEPACREVTQYGHSAGGATVGAIIGYAVGRELDRSHRHHSHSYNYSHGRGHYYRDHYHRHPRIGRYSGAISGAYIGGTVGSYGRTTTVCERYGRPPSRDVLVGHRVIVRRPDGSTFEYFEPRR